MNEQNIKNLEEYMSDSGMERREGKWLFSPQESEKSEVDAEAGTMVVTISTKARDRAGDVLEPGGCMLDDYRRNPVVLWAHDSTQRPVAKSLWTKSTGEAVIAKPKFHRKSDLSREVFDLYAGGYLKAWSVGFIPRTFETLKNDDGLDYGYRVLSWDLLEYSAVPVPANPEALSRALKDGRVTAPLLCRAFEIEAPDLAAFEIVTEGKGEGVTATAEKEDEKDTDDTEGADVLLPEVSADEFAAAVRTAVGGEIRSILGRVD